MRKLYVTILLYTIIQVYSLNSVSAQTVKKIYFPELEQLLSQKNDTTYIVNFWATWCAPCVKELPNFETIGKELAQDKAVVLLVSLDFPNAYENRLIPFVEEKQLQSRLYHMQETNPNSWIDKVDSTWTGAIPATIIYNKETRTFYEQEFSYVTLKEETFKAKSKLKNN